MGEIIDEFQGCILATRAARFAFYVAAFPRLHSPEARWNMFGEH